MTDGLKEPDATTWLRDTVGGSVYLRLTTRSIVTAGSRRKVEPNTREKGGSTIGKPR
jgi:hypothetical protein